jgi:hypothetical protein
MTNNEELLKELARRVHLRRQEGRYPAGLEEQLSAEFDAIIAVVHRGDDTVDDFDTVIKALEEVVNSKEDSLSDGQLKLIVQALRLIQKQLLQQKETDARVMKQLEHAVMDRILMVDVLAEAVLELERKVGPGA